MISKTYIFLKLFKYFNSLRKETRCFFFFALSKIKISEFVLNLIIYFMRFTFARITRCHKTKSF